jgi:hypothetical protein
MSDPYAAKRARVAAIIKKWKTGTVTLTRSTLGTPDPEEPWVPGVPTTVVYTLDARVDGVSADYVDEDTILSTDEMVIASPEATDPDGTVVDIEPQMDDALHIDGALRAIKKIEQVPSAGPPARFHIFIAS